MGVMHVFVQKQIGTCRSHDCWILAAERANRNAFVSGVSLPYKMKSQDMDEEALRTSQAAKPRSAVFVCPVAAEVPKEEEENSTLTAETVAVRAGRPAESRTAPAIVWSSRGSRRASARCCQGGSMSQRRPRKPEVRASTAAP